MNDCGYANQFGLYCAGLFMEMEHQWVFSIVFQKYFDKIKNNINIITKNYPSIDFDPFRYIIIANMTKILVIGSVFNNSCMCLGRGL